MRNNQRGRIALAALLTLSAVGLTACASAAADASGRSRADGPKSTATSTATPSPTPTPSANPNAATDNEATTPVWPADRCQDEQLAAELVARPDLSGAGREGLGIVLTNISEQSCSYYGWPGVLLLGADGSLLTSRDDQMIGGEAVPGALRPGESAQVEALLTAVGAYSCTPTSATTVRVLVTSDGAGPGIDAPAALQVCGDARSDFSAGPLAPAS